MDRGCLSHSLSRYPLEEGLKCRGILSACLFLEEWVILIFSSG
jgi:hypothetical protein